MRIFYGFDNISLERPAVVSVGSFDGVHRGHRELLERVRSMAQGLDALSVVVSFEPHPRIAMGRAEGMRLLTTVEERALLLERERIDVFVVAHFDEKFRAQSFEEFVRGSLVAKLGMRGMVVGYNHRLGRGSEGSYDSLVPLGAELGFSVERVEQFTASGDKVSSTVVRNLFEMGDVERACDILGHRYVVMGVASEGELKVKDDYKLIPADGTYRVNIVGHGEMVVNIVSQNIVVDKSLRGKIILEF
ncbi:MAG: adenylyltransferase/cytidyltransferase family protein [Alistipes sp.]|nr:adenylyltransferase/cytidyltransferase family protein [Alistipes sp.]